MYQNQFEHILQPIRTILPLLLYMYLQVSDMNNNSLFNAVLKQFANVPDKYGARHLRRQLAVYLYSNREGLYVSFNRIYCVKLHVHKQEMSPIECSGLKILCLLTGRS